VTTTAFHGDGAADTADPRVRFVRLRRAAGAAKDLLGRASRANRPRLALVACLLAMFAVLGLALSYLSPSSPGRELSLDRVAALIEQERVTEAVLRDEDARVEGTFASGISSPSGQGVFWASYPKSDSATGALLTALTGSGADVRVDNQAATATVRLLATVLLPLMILANLFALLFTAGKGGGATGELSAFGSIRKGGKNAGRAAGPRTVTFADVAGADEAVVELQEVVDYLSDPSRYAALSASPPKGVLLFGPPGTGKTLLARATAGEAGVAFFSVAGAEFVESLVGVGAARVRDLFTRVRAAAPAIVFIDELDAAGRRRGSGEAGGGSDEREQTLNQLLVELDGFDASSGVVVMAATNRPDILDPALLRPGRFDRHVTIDAPDAAGRRKILGLHSSGKPMGNDVDLNEIARRTPGFTGADLANVVNEAALLTIRAGRPEIGAAEMTEAVERLRGGPQRRGRVLTAAERERISVREAAHALVIAATGRPDDVEKVSILARGSSAGTTRRLGADADAVLLTRSQLLARLTQSLGGSAGELLRFGEASTGSEGDLQVATDLARDLAARYGMSDALGPVRLLAHDSDGFLGGTARLAAVSSDTHTALDAEIRRLVENAQAQALALLEQHRDLLNTLVDTLIEREHLEGRALQQLLAGVSERTGPDAPAHEPKHTLS
jgi:cell division protease FtsH